MKKMTVLAALAVALQSISASAVVIEGQLTSMESRQSKLLERYLPEHAGMGRAYVNR